MYRMVGVTRIVHVPDADLYGPDESGKLAYISPMRVEPPDTPESTRREPGGHITGNVRRYLDRLTREALAVSGGDRLPLAPIHLIRPPPPQNRSDGLPTDAAARGRT
jgi:hypothetical protein